MNDRIKEIARQAGLIAPYGSDTVGLRDFDYLKFAHLIVDEAFRKGILYSAKKYEAVGDETFIGYDVSAFLEMEAVEVKDDDVRELFGIGE